MAHNYYAVESLSDGWKLAFSEVTNICSQIASEFS
jgi:hypothetical protein